MINNKKAMSARSLLAAKERLLADVERTPGCEDAAAWVRYECSGLASVLATLADLGARVEALRGPRDAALAQLAMVAAQLNAGTDDPARYAALREQHAFAANVFAMRERAFNAATAAAMAPSADEYQRDERRKKAAALAQVIAVSHLRGYAHDIPTTLIEDDGLYMWLPYEAAKQVEAYEANLRLPEYRGSSGFKAKPRAHLEQEYARLLGAHKARLAGELARARGVVASAAG